MELELGLKITRTREDVPSSVDFRFSKDPFGPLVLSRETDSKFIIIIHLKGFKKEGIGIEINEEGNRITIRGRKAVEEMVVIRWMAWRKEVELRTFRKVFRIPDIVDLDKIKARFDEDDATLTIKMPKRVKGISGFKIEEEEEEEEERVEFGDTSEVENREEELQKGEIEDENVERQESDEQSEKSETDIQREEEFGEIMEAKERESHVLEGEEKGFNGGLDEDETEVDNLEKNHQIDEHDKILQFVEEEIGQEGVEQELANSNTESEEGQDTHEKTRHEEQNIQELVEQQETQAETKSDDFGSKAFEEIEEEEPDGLDRTSKREAMEKKTTDDDDDNGFSKVQGIEERELGEPERRYEERKIQELVEGETSDQGKEIEKMGERLASIERTQVHGEDDIAEAETKADEFDSDKLETDRVEKIDELVEKKEENAKAGTKSEDISLLKLQEIDEHHSKGKKRHNKQEKIKNLLEEKILEAETTLANDTPKPVQERFEGRQKIETNNQQEEYEEKIVERGKKINDAGSRKVQEIKQQELDEPARCEKESKIRELEKSKTKDEVKETAETETKETESYRSKALVEQEKIRELAEEKMNFSKNEKVKEEEETAEKKTEIGDADDIEQRDSDATKGQEEKDEIQELVLEEKVSDCGKGIIAVAETIAENDKSRKVQETDEKQSHEEDKRGKHFQKLTGGEISGFGEVEDVENEKKTSEADKQIKESTREVQEIEKKDSDVSGKSGKGDTVQELQENRATYRNKQEEEKKKDKGSGESKTKTDDDLVRKIQGIREQELYEPKREHKELVEGKAGSHEKEEEKEFAESEIEADCGSLRKVRGSEEQELHEPEIHKERDKAQITGGKESSGQENENFVNVQEIKPESHKKQYIIQEVVEAERNDRKEEQQGEEVIAKAERETDEDSSKKVQEIEKQANDDDDGLSKVRGIKKPERHNEGSSIQEMVDGKTDDEGIGEEETKKIVKTEIKNGDPKEELDAKMGDRFAPNIAETEVKAEDFESDKLEANEADNLHELVEKKEEEEKNANVRRQSEDISLISLQETEEQHSKGQKRRNKQDKIKELEEEKKPEAETNIANDTLKPLQERCEGKHKFQKNFQEETNNQQEEHEEKIIETGKKLDDADARKVQEIRQQVLDEPARCETQESVKSKTNDEEKEIADTETKDQESSRPKILGQQDKIQEIVEEKTNFPINGNFKEEEEIAEKKTEFGDENIRRLQDIEQRDSDAMKGQEEKDKIQELVLEEKVSDGGKGIIAVAETITENDKSRNVQEIGEQQSHEEDKRGKHFQKLTGGEISGCGEDEDVENEKKTIEADKRRKESTREAQEIEKKDSDVSGKYGKGDTVQELQENKATYRNEQEEEKKDEAHRPEKITGKIEQELVNPNSQLEQGNIGEGEKTQELVEEETKDCKEEEMSKEDKGREESKTKTGDDVVRKVQAIKEQELYEPKRNHVSKIKELVEEKTGNHEKEEKENAECEIEAECGSLRKVHGSEEQELNEPKIPKERDKTQITVAEEPSGQENEEEEEKIVESETITENENSIGVHEIKEEGPEKPKSHEERYKIQEVVKAGHNDRKEEEQDEKVISKAERGADEDSSKKVQEIGKQKYDELKRSMVPDKMQETEEKDKTRAMEEKEIVERRTKSKDGSFRKVRDDADPEPSKPHKRRQEDKIQELVEMGKSDYREKVKKQDVDIILRSREVGRPDLDEFERHGEQSNISQLVEEEKLENIAEAEDSSGKFHELGERESYGDWTHEEREKIKDLVKEEATDPKDKHTGGEGGQEEERYEKVEDEIYKKVRENKELESNKQEQCRQFRERASDGEKEEENLVDDFTAKIQESEKEESHREKVDEEDEESEEAAAVVAKNEDGISREVETVGELELEKPEKHKEQNKIPEITDHVEKEEDEQKVAETEEVPKSSKVREINEQKLEEKTENCKDGEGMRGEKGKQGKTVETMSSERVKTESEDRIVRKIPETKEQESNEKKNQEQEYKIEELEGKETSNHEAKLMNEDDSLRKGKEFESNVSKRRPVEEETIPELKQVEKREDEEKAEVDQGIKELLKNGEHDKIPELIVNRTKYDREDEKGMKDREIEEMKRTAEDVSSRKVHQIKAQKPDELEKHQKPSEIPEKHNIQEPVEAKIQDNGEEEMNEGGGYKAPPKIKSIEDSSQSQNVEEKGSDQPERYAEQEKIQELMAEEERKEEYDISEKGEQAKRIPQVELKANDDTTRKSESEEQESTRLKKQEKQENHQELMESETSDQRKEEKEEEVVGKAEIKAEYDSSTKIHGNEERGSDKLERNKQEEMSEEIPEEETSDDKEGNRAGAVWGEGETKTRDDSFGKVSKIEEQELAIVVRHREQAEKQSFVEKETSGKAKESKNQETESRGDSSRNTQENEKHEQKRNEEQDQKKNLGLVGEKTNYCKNEEDGKEDKDFAEVPGKLKGIEKRELAEMVERHENRDNIEELVEETLNNQEGEDKKSILREISEKAEDHVSKGPEGLRKQDKNREQETSEQERLKEQGRNKELVEDRTHYYRETEFEDGGSEKIQEMDKEETTEPGRDKKQDKIQEPVDRETSEDEEEELEVEFEKEEEDWEAEVIQEIDSDEDNGKNRQIRKIKLGFRSVGGSALFMSFIVIFIRFIHSKRKIRCYKL